MTITEYVRVLRRSWWVVLVSVLVGVAVAGAYSLLVTPKYEATSEVFVSVRSSDTAVAGELAQGSTFARQAVQSYVVLANKEIVLARVIAELNLDVTPTQLGAAVSATNPLNTVLIQITVTDEDPQLAAEIANSVATNLSDVVVNELEKPAGDAPSPVEIQVVQSALVPASPVSPRIPLNLALGALVGLAIGIGAAVLREVLDTRVRTPHDLELITDVPTIGRISFDPNAPATPLVVHADPLSPRSESFRTLRTNVRFIDSESANRSFLITSSMASEGKTTTAANLAITLAEQGARVALVDADLRRPNVATVMGIDGSVGLTDVLIGRAELTDALQKWGRGRLFVLPAGTIPPNPSELLGSSKMEKLHSTLLQHFDFVILDSPPTLAVTDATVLSEIVNGVLVVVASGVAQKTDVAAMLQRLHAVDAPVAGVVVTMVPTKGPDAYGYGDLYGNPYAHVPDARDSGRSPNVDGSRSARWQNEERSR